MISKESLFQAKLKHIQIINNFYSSLIGTNDYKEVARLAVIALMKYSGSPSVAIFEYDKESALLRRISTKGFGGYVRQASISFPLHKSITGFAVKQKRIVVIKDLSKAKGIDEGAQKALMNDGYNSVISFPLLYGKEVLGAANLIFHNYKSVKLIDRDAIFAISKTIAMALANAKYIKSIEEEIKKRYLTETELLKSEIEYRELVENINDMVVKFDTKGKLLYVSPNYCKMFNLSPEKILGKKYLPRIHADDIFAVQNTLKLALKPPFTCQHEERMLTINGWRWIHWSNRAVECVNGEPKEIIALGRDITERKITELALVKSEENVKSILKAIPDLLFKINSKGTYLEYIAPPGSSLSIPRNNVVGRNISETLPPDVYKTTKLKIKKVLFTGNTEMFEYSMPHGSSTRFFEGRLVKSGEDEVLVIVRDITDIKVYREQLKILALIASENDNGIIVTDSNNVIEWVNGGFSRITGYTFEEAIGKTPGKLLMGENYDVSASEFVQTSLKHGEKARVEVVNYDKYKNKFWVELNCQPVLDSKGKVSRFVYMQIVTTERKNYELKLKQQQEKLTELTRHLIAMREAERADIARGIHDELGQIVAAVKMNLTFLINDLQNNTGTKTEELIDELKAMSGMIDKSVYSIRRLIKNLRPETLDKLGLMPAVKQQLEDFKLLTKINYRLTKNFDELKIENNIAITVYRTIQESLTNIIKHSKADKVSVTLKHLNNNLELKISDNGAGIKQEDLNKSQSFGLFGMRQRIEGIGGTFSIQGKPGAGTSLSIKIPIE